MTTILNVAPLTTLTRARFYQLCLANPNVPMERTPDGGLIIMSPIGGEGGNREANLIVRLGIWNEQARLGVVFSSQTVFSLPGGGDRSPDLAWVQQERWDRLSPEERIGFPPLCPDFVIELRSHSDRLRPLQEKMQEYLACGLRLGWLINPQEQQVEIYRQRQPQEIQDLPALLSGEPPGFELQLERFTA